MRYPAIPSDQWDTVLLVHQAFYKFVYCGTGQIVMGNLTRGVVPMLDARQLPAALEEDLRRVPPEGDI